MTDKPKHLRLEIFRIDGWQPQWRAEHSDWGDEYFVSPTHNIISIEKDYIIFQNVIEGVSIRITEQYSEKAMTIIRLAVHEYNLAHGTPAEGEVKDIFTKVDWWDSSSNQDYKKIGTVEIIE